MKRCILIVLVAFLIVLLLLVAVRVFSIRTGDVAGTPATWWEFQSIDTMKYSRDLSREKINDPSFDTVIQTQVKNIADTGKTKRKPPQAYARGILHFFGEIRRSILLRQGYNTFHLGGVVR